MTIKKPIEFKKINIRRILIIRLGKIGDVLLTTPLLRNLRKNLPKAYITYIVGKRASPILENDPHISELIIANRNIFSEIMRREIYDLAIDLNVIDVTSQLCILSGAKYRVGVYGGRWVHKNYNIVLSNPCKETNAIDYFLSLLKLIGLKNDKNRKTELYLTHKEREIAQNRLKCFHKKIIGIQPACDIKGRLWPAIKFAQLADILSQKYNLKVLIFQTPGDESIALKMKNYMKHKPVLLPVIKLRQYLAVLNECKLYVANEGGQLHMAKALGIPTIGIFECSFDLNYWFYYKDNFIKIVSARIKEILIEQVIEEIEKNYMHIIC